VDKRESSSPLASPEPDQAVLTELGRVTWRAIVLEGLVDSICQFIKPANPREDRRSIGQKVRDARKVMRRWSASVVRDDADAWLTQALAALDSRNGLLHATVVRGFEDANGAVPHSAVLLMEPYLQREPTTLSLGVMPRGATPYAEISLAPGALEAVAHQLSDATRGSREVLLAIDEESKRQIVGDGDEGP
jgi:hypothetical protein